MQIAQVKGGPKKKNPVSLPALPGTLLNGIALTDRPFFPTDLGMQHEVPGNPLSLVS